VGRVREVVTLRRLARVPGVEDPFHGILSLRGEVVTVVGLAGLQGTAVAGDRPERQDTTGVTTGRIRPTRIDSVVVLRGGPDPLGLEVDGVEEIRDFASKGAGPALPPETAGSVAPAPGRMWAGIVRDERGELGVLDADAVFTMVEALAQGSDEPQALEVGDRGQG
jgi:chemotaxis signal transduction protein